MTSSPIRLHALVLLLFGLVFLGHAQSKADYGTGIRNIYLNANFGIINYNYDFSQLEEGYSAKTITGTTTFAGRFAVGYHFTKKWDAQLSVMRAADWATYREISLDNSDQRVWTNIWALSLRRQFSLAPAYQLFVEAGLSNVTRNGIELGPYLIVKDANYLYPIFGSGINYALSEKWQLGLNLTYSPPRNVDNQPATTFVGFGTTFSPKRPEDAVVAKNSTSPYYFPKHLLQLGYTSNLAGFGINKQFSGGLPTSIPVFWLGDVFVEQGAFIAYQQNVFHTYKNFSLEWGASAGYFKTEKDQEFYALSLYPVIKWWFLRTGATDVYFNYSLIGPAYISKSVLDGIDTGEKATFQDFMGIGFLMGKKRNFNIDLRIAHYSNGNIFTENPGVAIPLMLSVGYALY